MNNLRQSRATLVFIALSSHLQHNTVIAQDDRYSDAIQAWAESWRDFSCGSWQWQYEESPITALGPIAETISVCNGAALSRTFRIIPSDPDVLGVHQVSGFTERGNWFIIDYNTDTYDDIRVGDDAASRWAMYEMFVGLAPSAVTYFVNSGDLKIRNEDLSFDESASKISWSPSEMPTVIAEFQLKGDRTARIRSITRTSGSAGEAQVARFEYIYADSASRLPTRVTRHITLDSSAKGQITSNAGVESLPPSKVGLTLTAFISADGPQQLFLDTGDLLKFDDEMGQVLDGDGEIVATYRSNQDRMSKRQWSTIGVLAGLSGIGIAVSIMIYRRIRS